MKTSMRDLVFIAAAAVATSSLAIEDAPIPKISENNPAAVAPSPAVSNKIITGLPKFDPAAPPAPVAPAEPKPGDPVKPVTREDIARAANPDNADTLVLEKMGVKQKPRPRLTEDGL